jgi:hypothetical protein
MRLRGSSHRSGPSAEPGGATSPGRRTLTGSVMRRAARAPEADAAEIAAPGGDGAPLPDDLRTRAETSLGADLGGVRVHTGDDSAVAADALGARAFAVGQDIHFGAGEYAPGTSGGDLLIAHEVAHTAQQRGTATAAQTKLEVSEPGDTLEVEADRAAAAIVSGQPAQVSAAGSMIARDTRTSSPVAPAGGGQPPGQGQPAGGGQPPGSTETGGPATHIRQEMFVVTGGPPQLSGVTTAAPRTDVGQVFVQGPRIEQRVDVALASGVTLGQGVSVDVGPIQTLLGSERVGVYRRGGDPGGPIMAEDRGVVGVTRDSGWHVDPASRQVVSSFPAPWYANHYGLLDAYPSHEVRWDDRPGIYLRPALAGDEATLTEVRGADRFVTSISAKRGDQLVHLRTYQWSVPWDVRIDQTTATGQGRAGQVTEGGAMTMPRGTDIVAGHDHRYIRYADHDSAMAAPALELFRALGPALAEDRAAAATIAGALRAKNPAFRFNFFIQSKSNVVGDDAIELTIAGSLERRESIRGGTGATRAVTFHLLDVFNPDSIRAGSQLRFSARATNTITGSNLRRASWRLPFEPQRSVRMEPSNDGDGIYVLRELQLDE